MSVFLSALAEFLFTEGINADSDSVPPSLECRKTFGDEDLWRSGLSGHLPLFS